MYGTRLNTISSSAPSVRTLVRPWSQLVFLALAASVALGCGRSTISGTGYHEPVAASPDAYGITPAGAQNIGHARELIYAGAVPEAADIAIEGLLSEHDIPTGSACDAPLCARPAVARALDLATGEMAYWLYLGMTNGFSRTDFVRPPLDVVVAIDKSASMAIDMDETNEAVTRLIDHLRADDQVAIIAFDSEIHTIKELGPVGDRHALKEQIRAIRAGGGWDLMQATGAAYDVLDTATASSERLRRVMMFSCGYPELAADGRDVFSMEVHNAALAGVGMSFFGVLLDYHAQLSDLLGNEMGGSVHYLDSFDRIVQVFDQDFDSMVTPMAYDLDLSFTTGENFEVVRFFGLAGDDGTTPSYEVDAATAFLSHRRGAIVARLDRIDDLPLSDLESMGTIGLSYLPEPALGWTAAVQQVEQIAVPDAQDDESFYTSRGARKAVVLVNLGQQLQSASASYHAGQVSEAIAALEALSAYVAAESQALGDDESLTAEIGLVDQLIANMQ